MFVIRERLYAHPVVVFDLYNCHILVLVIVNKKHNGNEPPKEKDA